MSRPTSAAAPSSVSTLPRGRHRIENTAGLRVADLPGVRPLPQARRGTALFRAMMPSVSAGRHTWAALTHAGGRPRTAFAIILSL
jgi:hypothetical protein